MRHLSLDRWTGVWLTLLLGMTVISSVSAGVLLSSAYVASSWALAGFGVLYASMPLWLVAVLNQLTRWYLSAKKSSHV